MSNIFSSMESLKKEGSIRVYTGMTVVFPHYSKEETLNICELAPKFNGCYAMNNSTVCFVCENEVFVTPYTIATLRTLRSADFREDYFYVPFSNGDYPQSEKLKWYSLRRIVIQCQAEDFAEDCNAYCDSHHIGTISDDTLSISIISIAFFNCSSLKSISSLISLAIKVNLNSSCNLLQNLVGFAKISFFSVFNICFIIPSNLILILV